MRFNLSKSLLQPIVSQALRATLSFLVRSIKWLSRGTFEFHYEVPG